MADLDHTPIDSGQGVDTPRFTLPPTMSVLTLVEDRDGIPPSGTVTADRTPSFRWTTTGGLPPYTHRWVLTSGGSFYSSGSTTEQSVALSEVEIGAGYQVEISSWDQWGGGGISQTKTFTVISSSLNRPVRAYAPLDGDITAEEVVSDFPVRYYPRWMPLYGTADAEPSGSLFYRFWQTPLRLFDELGQEIQDTLAGVSLTTTRVSLPRLAWQLQTRFRSTDYLSITYAASGSSGTVLRALDEREFLLAEEPVYLLDDSGQVLFRNLIIRSVPVAAVGFTGDDEFRYEIPQEPQGILADADIKFQLGAGDWYKLKAGSPSIDPLHAVIQLASPYGGDIVFRYHSLTLLPQVTVSVSGQPFQRPDAVDLWNRFDEHGLLVGLERRPRETNLDYRTRVQARYLSEKGSHPTAYCQHVAQDLTLHDLLIWDGRSTLSLTASGYYGVRAAYVRGVPELATSKEELLPIGTPGWYSSSKSDWDPGWQMIYEGALVSERNFPEVTLSGNLVNLHSAVSGQLEAEYRYHHFTPTYSDEGFLTSLVPVQANLPSGTYQVLLTYQVQAFTARDPDFMSTQLLNPDGSANAYFRELRSILLEDSPVFFSRARWGNGAAWLTNTETLPQVTYLPLLMDQSGADYE